MDFEKKRWISLTAGVVLNLLGGIAYAWSVFVLPLNAKYGWTLSQLALAYTLMSVTMLVANMTLIPWMRRKTHLKNILITGGILYGCGIAVSGYISNLILFYFSYSIVAGVGDAMIYPVLIAYSQELFPEKPGFASGLMAAGLGLGSVVLATAAGWLFAVTQDVSTTMMILGVAFLIGIFIAAMFIYEVPEGFHEYINEKFGADNSPDTRPVQSVFLYEKPRKEMLRDKLFYALYICIILGAICGTMIITQGSPIMQTTFSMSAKNAALVVSIFSVANTVGRPIWGRISDKIGRINSFILLHAMMSTSMCILFICRIESVFVAALMLAMLCFGGIATLVAPITADFWGTKYITENYGITFSVFGISSLIGAPLIAVVLEKSGAYDMAFLIGLIMSLAGLALSIAIFAWVKKIRTDKNEI